MDLGAATTVTNALNVGPGTLNGRVRPDEQHDDDGRERRQRRHGVRRRQRERHPGRRLQVFLEGITFDATTTSNVRLVGHGTGTGTVRLGMRGNSSGAGAGESRDIDDDANGDDIADNPATNGAVITWIDYFTEASAPTTPA